MLAVVVLNRDTTQYIGINYHVSEYKIPLYLKLYNFYGRHLNYDYLVNDIVKNSKSDLERVIIISKWAHNNIKKIPDNIEVIDSHPLTIAKRRLGTKEQFSDLLSVMLVYADIESALWYYKNDHRNAVTLFKVSGSWSVIDPYYGVIFVNNSKQHASIDELSASNKKNVWSMLSLDYEALDENNFTQLFGSRFENIMDAKMHYINLFNKLPTQDEINNKNIYELGGRAYTQSPINRLQFILSQFVND